MLHVHWEIGMPANSTQLREEFLAERDEKVSRANLKPSVAGLAVADLWTPTAEEHQEVFPKGNVLAETANAFLNAKNDV